MEFLVFLAVIGLVIYWASSRRKSSASRKEVITPAITISTSITSSSSSFENPDTGAVTATSDGRWVLNPRSTFPLTIYGIDQATAEKLKMYLDHGYTQGIYAQSRALLPIIARSNLQCKEIDDYVRKFKPQYLKYIEDLKQSSSEWACASEKDREDLLVTFRNKAIESLDVRPYCDLIALFEDEPKDATIDDAVIDKFGFENFQLYLRYAGNLGKVRLIPADHRERTGFENLVVCGLAIRGADIPLSNILETLTLKEMNELVADLNLPSLKRKATAIDSLTKLPDIKDRVGKKVAFRELFQLKALPQELSHLDIRQISSSWRYAYEVAMLLAHTYVMGGSASGERRQKEEYSSFILGWEILATKDESSCAYCKRAEAKDYPKTLPPKVPLHIGCRCTVLPKLRK